jgi:predicted NBD/HSP70 family sugar kinase
MLDPTTTDFLTGFARIATAANAGNTQARHLIEQSARYLGCAAVTITTLFDLDLIVLAHGDRRRIGGDGICAVDRSRRSSAGGGLRGRVDVGGVVRIERETQAIRDGMQPCVGAAWSYG